MSKFTPTFTAEFEFQGDKIKGRFKRFLNRHWISFAPYLVPDENAPAALRAGTVRSMQLIEAGKESILECTLEFEGLKDGEGNPLTMKDVIEQSYFASLLDEVFGKIMQESALRGDDIKKSDAQQPADVSGEAANTTSSPAGQAEAGTMPSPAAQA